MRNSFWLKAASSRTLKTLLAPVLPENVAFEVAPGLTVFLDPRDRTGPSFYLAHGGPEAFDHYEESEKEEIERLLPQDGVFIDAGANIGLFSLWVARRFPKAKVYAFEPHPLLATCLTLSVDRSIYGQNIQVYPAALGATEGAATLHAHKTSSGGHSLIATEIEKENRGHTISDVQVYTIDGLVERGSFSRVDFIKADVQGFENEVLKGGAATIRKSRPALLLELENRALAQGGSFFEQYFEDLGEYRFRVAGEVGTHFPISQLPTIAQRRLGDGRLHTNFLFAPTTL